LDVISGNIDRISQDLAALHIQVKHRQPKEDNLVTKVVEVIVSRDG